MNNKISIALFSPYFPSLNTSASARKIFEQIRLSYGKGYLVHLLSFCSQDDEKEIEAIRPFCASLTLERLRGYSIYPKRSFNFRDKIKSLSINKELNIVQCEKAYMARYLPRECGFPSLLVEQDILSASFRENAGIESNIFRKIILYIRCLKKLREEREWFAKFDKIIVFTEHDRRVISDIDKRKGLLEVIPLGINLADYEIQQGVKKEYDLLYFGNYTHLSNVDGLSFFFKQIYPILSVKCPDLSIAIAGIGLPSELKRLVSRYPRVCVLGYVHDHKALLQKSKILVLPVRYGGGMRYKILEAMALGVAVVTTGVGIRGLEDEKCALVSDTPEKFSLSVQGLLADLDKYKELSRFARLAVERKFCWETLFDKYEKIYQQLIGK